MKEEEEEEAGVGGVDCMSAIRDEMRGKQVIKLSNSSASAAHL